MAMILYYSQDSFFVSLQIRFCRLNQITLSLMVNGL